MGTTTSKDGIPSAAVHARSGRMAALPGDAPTIAPPRSKEEAVARNSIEARRSSDFRRTGSAGSAGLAPRLSIDSNRSRRSTALPGDNSNNNNLAVPFHILRAASRGDSFGSQ